MKLVEAEAEGPIEGEEAVVTPPRPLHRRVSISLLFTLTVLTGTVVAIYLAFPARHDVLLTEAIAQHQLDQTWDLASPSAAELRAWSIGVVGKGAPLPDTAPAGARDIKILDRRAALMRFAVGADSITYLVQRARGIGPARIERTDGDLLAVASRRGKFAWVVVGPKATSAVWLARLAPR
ncbi:MAG TPA: hypothetical protein VN253_25810 [Kofleriaceae bacterium]|nr:hypothetical protein [Kofleriaceae bacterium]